MILLSLGSFNDSLWFFKCNALSLELLIAERDADLFDHQLSRQEC